MTHDMQQFQQPALGDNAMNDAKRTVKQKAVQGMMEYLFISFYLGVVLSLFTVYKVVILAEHNIDFAPHGFAIINALALAKIILVAQELHFAEQLRDAPLIYPTLLKSFAFTMLLAFFKVVEHTSESAGAILDRIAPRKRRDAAEKEWTAGSRFHEAVVESRYFVGHRRDVSGGDLWAYTASDFS